VNQKELYCSQLLLNTVKSLLESHSSSYDDDDKVSLSIRIVKMMMMMRILLDACYL